MNTLLLDRDARFADPIATSVDAEMPEDRIDLEVRIATVETKQEGHEKVCAERYGEIKDSVKAVNESVVATRREMRDGQQQLRNEYAAGQEKMKAEFDRSNERLKADLIAKQDESARERSKQIDDVKKTQNSMLAAVWTLCGTTVATLLTIIAYLLNIYVIKGGS